HPRWLTITHRSTNVHPSALPRVLQCWQASARLPTLLPRPWPVTGAGRRVWTSAQTTAIEGRSWTICHSLGSEGPRSESLMAWRCGVLAESHRPGPQVRMAQEPVHQLGRAAKAGPVVVP